MFRSALVVCLLAVAAEGLAAPGYYRFPSLHGETVVFTAEGDIWSVPVAGGDARRLTTHPSFELGKAISPDGKWIAFNAAYEGPTEVYVMPLAGGLPRQITFEGHFHRVLGWSSPTKILTATSRYAGPSRNMQLVELDIDHHTSSLVPLFQASDGAWNDNRSSLFFTRFEKQSSYTKRYKGGTAQNLWRFDAGAQEAVPLTADYPGTSRHAMWWNGRVYFATDRDGTMNLWSMLPDGSDVKQHTRHDGFDVRTPQLDAGRIVYQLGADLRLYDVAQDADRPIDIRLISDFDQTREKWITNPTSFLSEGAISPAGDRIALISRGQLFVSPVPAGRIEPISRKRGVRYREVSFSSDGKSLIVLSDESGEFEFWKFELDAIDRREQLTNDGQVLRYGAVLSPDGKFFTYQDKNQHLWLYDLTAKTHAQIAESLVGGFNALAFSPDSKHLVWSTNGDNDFSQIWMFDVATRTARALTSERIDAHSPTWSRDGNRLFFIVDQNLASEVGSPWGMRQPEPFFDNVSYIYELPLKTGLRSIFEEPNEATKQVTLTPGKDFDFEGLALRMSRVPLPPGNYSNLAASAQNLLFVHRDGTGPRQTHLRALKLGPNPGAPRELLTGAGSFTLSLDARKALSRAGNNVFVFDANVAGTLNADGSRVNLAGWSFAVDPREEWRQMFIDAWRMERDYFYDRGLHGVDWKHELDRHLPLVDRVTDRSELNDLLTQIVGELEALHIFVSGGDQRGGTDNIQPGSLGVDLLRDVQAGGYRIVRIPRWDPDYPEEAPPLLRADPRIREGDVLLTINRVPVLDARHPAELLKNQTGRDVLLTIRSVETGQERPVLVKAGSAAQMENLLYSEWQVTRREAVEKQGDSQIGYVHLKAMGASDMSDWVKQYYPVYRRPGLIIDVRYNNGGNIDSWILSRLLRQAWFFWQPRVGRPYWNMHHAYRGHIVVLCNEWTASDGEAFSEGIKRLNLGTVIGTRTWGGEIWLSRNNTLVDNGIATAAQIGVFGPEGEWLIEGHGVEPHIVVDNLPHQTFLGRDAQLEAAIEFLQKKIAEEPIPEPVAPPYYRRATIVETKPDAPDLPTSAETGSPE